jgi:hypothetical protein
LNLLGQEPATSRGAVSFVRSWHIPPSAASAPLKRRPRLCDGPCESDRLLSLARPEKDDHGLVRRHESATVRSSRRKVALEAIRGELTLSQLGAKYGVHQTLINAWKKQAVENLSTVSRAGRIAAGRAARPTSRSRPSATPTGTGRFRSIAPGCCCRARGRAARAGVVANRMAGRREAADEVLAVNAAG